MKDRVKICPWVASRVVYQEVDGSAVGRLRAERLAPDPQPFGARVHGVAHGEAACLAEEDAVEEEGLAGAVHADDGDDGQRALNFREHIARLLRHCELRLAVRIEAQCDEWDRPPLIPPIVSARGGARGGIGEG